MKESLVSEENFPKREKKIKDLEVEILIRSSERKFGELRELTGVLTSKILEFDQLVLVEKEEKVKSTSEKNLISIRVVLQDPA